MKQLIIKAIGTPEQINNVIDYFPVEAVIKISEKKQNSENEKTKHQFIHIDSNKIEALVDSKKKLRTK